MTVKGASVVFTHGLVKCLNRKIILNGLDFLVNPGESVGVTGPNGAGKTTLLRVLASLMRADAGEISVLGFRLPEQALQMRKKMGMLAHQPLLYGDLTAEENLRFYTRLYDVKSPHQRIRDVLTLVGLSSRSQDKVRAYSRGMQQRLSIARVLLHEPVILFMDEPFTGLDAEFTGALSDYFNHWIADGRSIVMTGHDPMAMSFLTTRCESLVKGRFLSQNVTARSIMISSTDSRLDSRAEMESGQHE